MLQSLSQSLDQFDQAVGQETDGRRAHVGNERGARRHGGRLTQVVRLMDGLNRYRFADDPNSLAEWESASKVVGPPRSSGGKPVPSTSEGCSGRRRWYLTTPERRRTLAPHTHTFI